MIFIQILKLKRRLKYMEMSEKLGSEAAFPVVETQYNGITQNYEHNCTELGITRRLYVACSVMNLSTKVINTCLIDEDIIKDPKGYYYKHKSNYYIIGDYTPGEYSIKPESTYEKRLVRGIYKIVDELLKQENI